MSFVDNLSPSLCEAITGAGDMRRLLAQLRDLTPIFAESVDSDWSRIHPLAREFLLARFAQLPEAERREYHARAARWLEAHGLCEEAARQMLEAGLVDDAYELVARVLHDVLLRGQVSLVADWIERLPQPEILRRTSLRLTVGWILAQSDRHAEAAQLVGPIVDDAGRRWRRPVRELRRSARPPHCSPTTSTAWAASFRPGTTPCRRIR